VPRSILGGELSLLMSEHFETHARLLIDGTLITNVLGFDPLLSATWSADLDQLVQQATFRLHLGIESESISPLVTLAPSFDTRPLFDVGRNIVLQTACIPPGGIAEASDWHSVFDGILDDYDPASEPEDDVLTLTARDKCSLVLDTWIEDPEVITAPMPVGEWLAILWALGGGSALDFPPFVVVGDPSFVVNASPTSALVTPISSTLDAMRQAGLLNGRDLR
jgi:hypothetical protein